jgi:glycosyltransferase involved in cell wall biosynthesis
VVVLPSINQGEAFGLVLLEAMACSKPVIASNLPGVRSVFKNGNQGLLVKPGDVKDLVKKIKVILTDDQLAKRMGRAGRSLVINKYTWDKVGRRLDIIYHYVKYTPS